jgi:kynureninase
MIISLIKPVEFKPLPGAGGFQQSNPSVVDIASLSASLSVFAETSMAELRQKSLKLTAYLEHLLLSLPGASTTYRIITPSEPEWRGAQLCLLLIPGLLPKVAAILEANGIIIDQRKPDVMRVAPLPLYNTYSDVWQFVQVFSVALKELQAEA